MLIVVAALLLLLPLLAILQYHWLAQLSEREQEHMKSNLRAIATRFSQDLDDELTRAYAVFTPSHEVRNDDGLSAFAARHDRWTAVAQYPRLVRDVLVAHVDETGQLHLHQLKNDTRQFVQCDWPSELSELKTQLEQISIIEQRPFLREMMSHRVRPINDQVMAFVHPILIPPMAGQRGQISLPPPLGFVIITISLSEIQKDILPALAKRHFSSAAGAEGFDYSAVVDTQTPEHKVIYQFGPPPQHKTDADIVVGLMGLRREMLRQMYRFPSAEVEAPPRPAPPPPDMRGQPPRAPGVGGPINEEQKLWQLHLTHRAGSLDAAVSSLHRRNLLISFGVLALMAVSIALMIQSARRAQRLARREMDFVAGVSHELRTPLAVIKSAAWSLTRGVIREEEQIRRYSELIGKESDRLIEMIEQVLEFAGARSGRQKLELQPVSVHEVIDNVLATSQPLFGERGFQIDREIANDLPRVMADPQALSRALRNLIDNAMKYSGESRWISVRAQGAGGGKKDEVQISVIDRGLGIPANDQKYIFEPFWRGDEAASAQIHGNGLGLNLVRTIIKAHGGGVSVRSEPGRGSSFTMTLPAIAETDARPATAPSYLDTGATS